MGFLSDKPYTAVTQNIERLTSEEYQEDDVADIVDLVDIIRIRPSGPTEAARAIRKKLKYGSVHKQLRALTILDALVQNGGRRLTHEFLLERLRIEATDSNVDSRVRKKTQALFLGWANQYKNERGYERLAELSRQLPQRQRKPRAEPKYLSNDMNDVEEDFRESRRRGDTFEDDDEYSDNEHEYHSSSRRIRATAGGADSGSRSPSSSRTHDHGPSTSSPRSSKPPPRPERTDRGSFSGPQSSKDRDSFKKTHSSNNSRSKSAPAIRRVDLNKERPKILQALAESSSAATNLTNALQLINWEEELSTENKRATSSFNKCRQLRRRILQYIHAIESEEFLGPLIHANEELVNALKQYDTMSKPQDDDSDSDYENDDWKVESNLEQLDINRKSHQSEDDEESESESEPEPAPRPVTKLKAKIPPPVSPKPTALRTKHATRRADDDEDDPFGDSNVIV